jgi:oligopeptide/dipeptide ABC transporter ATP-binding protein
LNTSDASAGSAGGWTEPRPSRVTVCLQNETPKDLRAEPPLLSVSGLTVQFDTPAGIVRAVQDVSFDLWRNDILAIVGESGSGKSVTALAIMKLVPSPPGRYVGGKAVISGVDMMTLGPRELETVRGSRIGMIFQNPRAALNPSFTIATQLIETLRHHRKLSREQARREAIRMLREVGFADPERVATSYSHQLSGGMCQRIGIALSLACKPEILIADEPTTALDVVVQARMLLMLKQVHRHGGLPIIMITHDFGVVRALANRVIVMYAGRIQETGSVEAVLTQPQHPYTQALIQSVPDTDLRKERLYQVKGQPPDLLRLPRGCKFADRCEYTMDICRIREPDLVSAPNGAKVRCHLVSAAGSASE